MGVSFSCVFVGGLALLRRPFFVINKMLLIKKLCVYLFSQKVYHIFTPTNKNKEIEIMTNKELNKHLVSKKAGFNYTYVIGNKKYSINEYNNNRGWCLNEYELNTEGNYKLLDSYGYNGLRLKDCKEMIRAAQA